MKIGIEIKDCCKPIPYLYWNITHDKEPTKTIGAIAIHTKRLDSKASPLSL